MAAVSSAFVTTRWTRVLQARGAGPEASLAMSELCDAYYQPVCTFIRCSGPDEETAKDLTQEFFARLLARDSLGAADPARGRFRSYLLAAVKNFLRDAHARAHAAKRSPAEGTVPLEMDYATTAEQQLPDPNAPSPEREFDRKWALAVLDRALTALEREQSDRADEFRVLKPCLVGEASVPQAEVAAQLGLSEAALRVSIHRLRRRFRSLVKEEIAATLQEPSPARILEELQYLIEVVS